MFLKNTDVKRFCVLIMTILFVLGLSMYSFGKKEKFLQN